MLYVIAVAVVAVVAVVACFVGRGQGKAAAEDAGRKERNEWLSFALSVERRERVEALILDFSTRMAADMRAAPASLKGVSDVWQKFFKEFADGAVSKAESLPKPEDSVLGCRQAQLLAELRRDIEAVVAERFGPDAAQTLKMQMDKFSDLAIIAGFKN